MPVRRVPIGDAGGPVPQRYSNGYDYYANPDVVAYADGEPVYGNEWDHNAHTGEDYHPDDGFIYFIQAVSGGPIKIGYSKDPAARLKTLQTGHPEELVILRMYPGTQQAECSMHKGWERYQVRNEWFHPADAIMECIDFSEREDPRVNPTAATLSTPTGSRPVTYAQDRASGKATARIRQFNRALEVLPMKERREALRTGELPKAA